jgi:hypothetical protein
MSVTITSRTWYTCVLNMVEIGIETICVQFLCVKVFMVIGQVNKSFYLQAIKYFNAECHFAKI